MRTFVLGIAVFALTACDDPVEDAERELAIIEKTGGDSDKVCAAKRKVAEANLTAQRGDDYKLADLDAELACQRAKLDAAEL